MRKLVIANWKMHYGPVKAGAWIRAFRRERLPKDLDIGVAVPHVSLAAARASLGRAGVPLLGAQDAFWANDGAFTGEVSPAMLKEFGITFCLVGHSERRANLGETDEMVAKKAAALQKGGIRPVICIGETEAQRKKGETLKVVRAQLAACLQNVKGDGAAPPVIAYEPVWAIGTGKPCSPIDAKNVHEAIREALVKKYGKSMGADIRILYGGSVDARNVADYVSTTHIDGVLVGSASLDPRAFGMLCRAAIPA
ncbi:triose-phosphate isomerase [Candidatus Uhrbacteria bacterium]|nr:MAG: triose-phosphate isomerase [Candidatus Uhrbacteria bacterium]